MLGCHLLKVRLLNTGEFEGGFSYQNSQRLGEGYRFYVLLFGGLGVSLSIYKHITAKTHIGLYIVNPIYHISIVFIGRYVNVFLFIFEHRHDDGYNEMK